jgi:hypothetical protein
MRCNGDVGELTKDPIGTAGSSRNFVNARCATGGLVSARLPRLDPDAPSDAYPSVGDARATPELRLVVDVSPTPSSSPPPRVARVANLARSSNDNLFQRAFVAVVSVDDDVRRRRRRARARSHRRTTLGGIVRAVIGSSTVDRRPSTVEPSLRARHCG